MKRVIMTAAVLFCSYTFAVVQAQDTLSRTNKSKTMKKNNSSKNKSGNKKMNPRTSKDSMRMGDSMYNRRRDSM